MELYDFDEEELARKVLYFLYDEMGEDEVTCARVKLIAESIIERAVMIPLKVK